MSSVQDAGSPTPNKDPMQCQILHWTVAYTSNAPSVGQVHVFAGFPHVVKSRDVISL